MVAMAANRDIIGLLAQRFSQPLPECSDRRIVIWHDPDEEFGEVFASLVAEGQEGVALLDGHPVRCVDVRDGAMFATKLLINRQSDGQDLLLYRRRSRGDLEGDWLVDVELYADHFQADYLSLLIDELEAADTAEIREALRGFSAFLRSKERTAKLKAKLTRGQTARDIALGVLCVLLKAESDDIAAVVCAYAQCAAAELEEPGSLDELMADLDKYGARESLDRLLKRTTGFSGDSGDARAFLGHLLISALAASMDPEKLRGLERFMVLPNAEFCLRIVGEWHRQTGESKTSTLYEACQEVQRECNLVERFEALSLGDLLGADVFPCINEVLLRDLFRSVAHGSDRREDMRLVLETRRSMMWAQPFEVYFECLEAAEAIQSFYWEHTQGFELARAVDVWNAYLEDWWHMDAAYRSFCGAYRRSVLDLSSLDDTAKDLSEWVDKVYTNWFLAQTNDCWVAAAAPQWEGRGFVEGIPQQRHFYQDEVLPALEDGKCLVVGICDGMRYGVGCELAECLERETKGNAEVGAMQAVFPSETAFGMAALLPNRTMAFDEATGSVLVDGRSTRTTEDRQQALQSVRQNSKAVKLTDLLAMRPAEQKAFAEGVAVVYVYQNTIDKTGHSDEANSEVFDACEKAVRDMKALVDLAVRNMGARQVLITADHGFLFTHQGLTALDAVERACVSGEPLEVHRRFLRSDAAAESELLLHMNMEGLDGGEWSWWAARNCLRIKAPGSRHYVHGGISLQELCVPVIRFRNTRAGAKDFVSTQSATIKLLSTNRRIANSIFTLDFFQNEAVGGKVLATAYELCFTDASGNEVSDVRTVPADRTGADERERQTHVRFALKSGIEWESRATYYLVARDKTTSSIVWREAFSIEIAFAPLEEFDW